MFDWSQSSEEEDEEESDGRTSFGTPIMRLIPAPEKERRAVGSVLKSRREDTPFDLRLLTTSGGGGRLLATRP